jgi:repressor LexA
MPTPRQRQYLHFIAGYTRLLGSPPAEADMQRFFKVTPPSVHQMVLTLANRGFITRVPGQARSIRLTWQDESLAEFGGHGVAGRKRIRPKDRLELLVRNSERNVLLDGALLPSDLERCIRTGVARTDGTVARFTLDELDELAGFVAAEANHSKDKKSQKQLDGLFERIQALLDTHTDEDES